MIRHLWKLIRNRKKSNLMITLEISISFLMILAVICMGVSYLDSYGKPLGFAYRDLWDIRVDVPGQEKVYSQPNAIDISGINNRMNRLVQAVETFPEIAGAAVAGFPPYDAYNTELNYFSKLTFFIYGYDEVSDQLPKVMGMRLIRGRWFGKEDDGASYNTAVVNRQFAEKAFGSEDPVGKILDEKQILGKYSAKIVGIFDDYRVQGEFTAPRPFALFRIRLDASKPTSIPNRIMIRVRPGTPISFEEKLTSGLQSLEREWSFSVQPVENKRHDYLRTRILPLIVLGIVAFFLMLMAGSGLLGVLWLNITRRTQEFGLRRAHGATVLDIYKQLVFEMLLIASIGIGPSCLIILLIMPFLSLISVLQMGITFSSLVISVLVIYGMVSLCALYPAYLATRVQPAAALHYE
jgi:putative ABC transport system permease protein